MIHLLLCSKRYDFSLQQYVVILQVRLWLRKVFSHFWIWNKTVGSLCPAGNPCLENRKCEDFFYFGFGHNTSILGAASAFMEGSVRPSACDVENPECLRPNTFYARGVMFDSDSTHLQHLIFDVLSIRLGSMREWK